MLRQSSSSQHNFRKTNPIKSIYLQYLLGIRPSTAEVDSLNSKKTYRNNKKEMQQLKFKYTIKNTTIEAEASISYIDCIKDTDMILWIEKFKLIQKSTEWDEITSVNVLKALIRTEISYKGNSSKNILRALLNARYSSNNQNQYLSKLK